MQYSCYKKSITIHFRKYIIIETYSTFEGSEDTYVKFKVDKTVVHKSRAVHKSRNPKWLEPLQLNIQSLSIPIKLIVMSCEPGHMDKKIGEAAIVPQELSVNM